VNSFTVADQSQMVPTMKQALPSRQTGLKHPYQLEGDTETGQEALLVPNT
jgi:hypothetical protein